MASSASPPQSSSRSTVSSYVPSSREASALNLHKMANICLIPFTHAMKVGIHMMTPIRPGHFGNHSSYVIELAIRVGFTVLHLLISPLTLGLFVIGGCLHLIGDVVQKVPYTYLKGEGKEKQIEKDVKVFSLNGCMLFGGLSEMFGGASPGEDRVEKLAHLILEEDADVTFIQELSFSLALLVWERIKKTYAHGVTRIVPQKFLMLESGLCVFSKIPLKTAPRVWNLPTKGLMKRALIAIETDKGWLMTAHLEAGVSKKDEAMREVQLGMIKTAVETLQQESDKPCILAGDLNVVKLGRKGDEYDGSRLRTEWYDPRLQMTTTPDTATATNILTAKRRGKELKEEPFETLDYALVDQRSQNKVTLQTELVQTFSVEDPESALSDHRGLKTRVIFRG